MVYQTIFNFFGLLAVSIIFHELGHLVYLFILRQKAVLIYSLGKDAQIDISDDLTDPQYGRVLKAGIFAGAIPIIFGLLFLMTNQLSTFVVIGAAAIYFFYGVNGDMKELRKLNKKAKW